MRGGSVRVGELSPRLPLGRAKTATIAASVAHYLAGDGALFVVPLALIGALAVSYVTRPPTRRVSAQSATRRQAS